MNKGSINLQDTFLNQARKEKVAVTMFLINGYQLKGSIKSFDNFTILLEVDGKQQLIYKHAVSTVIPFRHLQFSLTPENKESNQE